MKNCHACGEEFENHFRFCPVDGTPIGQNYQHDLTTRFEVTLIKDEPLARRLAVELGFLLNRISQAWPKFKKDPIGFTTFQLLALGSYLRECARQPYVRPAATAAMALVVMVILAVALLDRSSSKRTETAERDDLSVVSLIDFASESSRESEPGVGAGEKGRVGFDKGRFEPTPGACSGWRWWRHPRFASSFARAPAHCFTDPRSDSDDIRAAA